MLKWIYEPSDNVLVFGDFNASYYMFPYKSDPDIDIVIKGQYPHARYMSITVGGETDIPIVSVYDQLLMPNPGSVNPFYPRADWDAENRDYTLIVRFAPPLANNYFIPGPGCNIVLAGVLPQNGKINRDGIITLRIYAPGIGYDKKGGVSLPAISYRARAADHADDSKTAEEPAHWKNYVANAKLEEQSSLFFDCELEWFKPNAVRSSLLQFNPNTVYMISSMLKRAPGKLLFIRWKAPAVPDTYHNTGITGGYDMRYWSVTFFAKHGDFGFKTIGDYQTVIDKNGFVNMVVSLGVPRPHFVTAENGFTWVDLADLPLLDYYILYRNVLVSPGFKYTAKTVCEGKEVPPEIMGAYYPCGKYVEPGYLEHILPLLSSAVE
jgi:hypothetical protein